MKHFQIIAISLIFLNDRLSWATIYQLKCIAIFAKVKLTPKHWRNPDKVKIYIYMYVTNRLEYLFHHGNVTTQMQGSREQNSQTCSSYFLLGFDSLPLACEVYGKVMFSVYLSVHWEGGTSCRYDRGTPVLIWRLGGV